MEVSINKLINQARQYEPSISVYCDNTYGEILIKGNIVFNTRGFAAMAVISGYLAGFIRANLKN